MMKARPHRLALLCTRHTSPLHIRLSTSSAATSPAAGYKVIPASLDLSLRTPQLSKQQTLKVILQNGMQGYIVSDPGAPSTGAALSVEAGSWQDGRHQGTAHFLEHMLFLGTKKYPNEYDYERFIFDANGTMNGYTASDHSLYYFSSVTPAAFDGALDQFARFFYEPLFNESCVDRERNAVDQEFRKNVENDSWRSLHVMKELANQSHPFAGFNTGNLETMKKIDTAELRDWYAKHYSANLMHFAIYGREPIDILAQKAEKAFSPIPNRNLPLLSTRNVPIYPKSLHGHIIWVKPIMDLREMSLTWEVPIEYADMATKPGNLVAHVLGYKGSNSLLAQLKAEHLVEDIHASKNSLGAQNLTFTVSFTLTEKGLDKWAYVVNRFYAALNALRNKSYPKHVFDESNYMQTIAYQFQQRNTGIATQACGLLRKEGITTFPRQSYFSDSFVPEKAHELMDLLTPESAVIAIAADEKFAGMKLDRTEKWMKGQYGVKKVEDSIMAEWKSVGTGSVEYPPPNPFVPRDLKLVSNPAPKKDSGTDHDAPQLLREDPAGKLYVLPDMEFQVPEAAYIFHIKTPSIRPDNPRSIVLSELYSQFVHDTLIERAVDASRAGLYYDVWADDTGVGVSIRGYSERALAWLQTVLEAVRDPVLHAETFENLRESLERDYRNEGKELPVRQGREVLSKALYAQYSTAAQLADAVSGLTLTDLEGFIQDVFKSRFIESFVGGNITNDDANAAWAVVTKLLPPGSPCLPSEVRRSPLKPVPTPIRPRALTRQTDMKGNAVIWSLRIGKRDPRLRTLQMMFTKLIKEPVYTELRTTQQTGYMVHSYPSDAAGELFVQVSVQSNSHDPRDLLSRVEVVMERMVREIQEGKEDVRERFENVKQATLARLRHPHDTLFGKIQYYYSLAYDEQYPAYFNYLEDRIRCLEDLTFEGFSKEVEEKLGVKNMNRLAVLVRGTDVEPTRIYLDEVTSQQADDKAIAKL
ncbi:Metalloenzyme, LuxS/M16 peptidase-like protein [Phlyctochytrium arcticum]|nr:Metalloenzyme, LuxS/M16 peptidase-like protein [Phlyctochytrium arcticum]